MVNISSFRISCNTVVFKCIENLQFHAYLFTHTQLFNFSIWILGQIPLKRPFRWGLLMYRLCKLQ